MVKMIESAEEFATLKKGDKPVRSPRPDAASPLFFTAPGLKNLITMPRGTRSPHPHHPDRTRAISRGPSHRAESSVQARGPPRGTRVIFVKVDVDDLDDVAAECGISTMPTFQLYSNGVKVQEMTGADETKLAAMAAAADDM